ncbi:MAG: 4-alpha-glucanotransferase [Thermomicrobiales bacterium]
MQGDRASGILAHPTSFPGPHGIGDLGDASYRFIDWLVVAGQRLWQVMPLGPTSFGDSPYASPSAFAGNPLLISLPWLAGEGLLENSDLAHHEPFHDYEVDFGRVISFKTQMLRRAFDRFRAGAGSALRFPFEQFSRDNATWLDDFALFMALKDQHGGAAWFDWEPDIRLRTPESVASWTVELKDEIRFHRFAQFLFRRQWADLKQYANDRQVRIIGDIPIFVARDSADVWANRRLFRLDNEGNPHVVSGVPPDYFSTTGQTWGNPIFDWHEMRKTGYAWWIDRIRATLHLVDIIRIDHFRGLAAAWSIPFAAKTAAAGRWELGPSREVFDAITAELGPVPFIVEDLGLITADVEELRKDLGYPGMAVLQFAFDGRPENAYLPHNYGENLVVYTGTHDNQTTVGWFHSLPTPEQQQVQRYIGRDGSDIAWDFIRLGLSSVANMAIFPLQDILRLGDEARMNTPGRAMGNWAWRYLGHQLHHGLAAGLGELTHAYGRLSRRLEEVEFDPFDYTAPGAKHPLFTVGEEPSPG